MDVQADLGHCCLLVPENTFLHGVAHLRKQKDNNNKLLGVNHNDYLNMFK